MHAEMRRMPPRERARHSKRLGHVQNGSGPVPAILANEPGNGKTTTTQDTKGPTVIPNTTTSTTEKSSSSSTSSTTSSAPATSTLATTEVLTPSSTTSASSTSSPSSSFSSTSPSSSSQVLAQTSTSIVVVSATPSLSTTPTSQTDATSSSSSGLSNGAIAGIVAVGVIAVVALLVFVVRKTYLRRRETKRISWSGSPGFGMKESIGGTGMFDEAKPLPGVPQSFSQDPAFPAGSPVSPFDAHGQSVYANPQPAPLRPSSTQSRTQYAVPSPPPASYNNPVVMPSYSSPPPPQLQTSPSSTTALGMARAAAGASAGLPRSARPSRGQTQEMPSAMVKCMFVPNLPDELSITMGERLHINAQYDDGWALCENSRGEQGMVPLECLEHVVTNQTDWKNTRRASSLNPDVRRC